MTNPRAGREAQRRGDGGGQRSARISERRQKSLEIVEMASRHQLRRPFDPIGQRSHFGFAINFLAGVFSILPTGAAEWLSNAPLRFMAVPCT
jgi:hypothetical protein